MAASKNATSFEIDPRELAHWLFGTWYPERIRDTWCIGAGYGSKGAMEVEGVVWSRLFYNLTRLPKWGEWIYIEIRQGEPGNPWGGTGEPIPLIKERLTEKTVERLTVALEQIKRFQKLDFAEGLCQLVHVYLSMSDWLRMKEKKPSCLKDLAKPKRRKLGKLDGMLDLWADVRDCGAQDIFAISAEDFAEKNPGRGGMPSYRTIPNGWIPFEELRKLYRMSERAFNEIKSLHIDKGIVEANIERYPKVPITVDLSEIEEGNTFRQNGEFWIIAYEDQKLPSLKHRDGFVYIAHLLQHPNESVPISTLRALKVKQQPDLRHQPYEKMSQEQLSEEGLSTSALGDSGEILDRQARKEYQRQLQDLEAEVEEDHSDPERRVEAQKEIKALKEQLSAGQGLGGRPRKVAGKNDRDRSVVTMAIKTALKQIKKNHQPLGTHLSNCIKTGKLCMYRPEKSISWNT